MQNSGLRPYFIKETTISSLINAAFSFMFAHAAFGGVDLVTKQELVINAIPQSLFVTFFGVLVPTLLTQRRVKANKIRMLPIRTILLPQNLLFRALVLAIPVALIGGGLHLIATNVLALDEVAGNSAVIWQTIYGAILAWVVTPLGLFIELSK